jgi:flagellar biosynthesis/type III secretory pathway chaperone
MSNPINLITESIDKININLDLIESKEQSVDNVKEQICNICSYNERLNQFNRMLYYATIVQPELAPVLAATKSLSKILEKFCNACANYENNKQIVLDKLKPYISQLRESLSTVQKLINENKKYIDSAYEKTKNVNNYFKLPYQQVKPVEESVALESVEPIVEPVALEPAAGGYKRRQRSRSRSKRRISRRRISKKRISKRKSIKKKSKKNRRR